LAEGFVIEGRKFQFGQGGRHQVYAVDELLCLVVEQGQREPAFLVRFGQAVAGSRGIGLALVLVVDDEVAEANQPDGGDALVRAVVKVFHPGRELLREDFLDPFALYGRCQSKQRPGLRAAPGDFAQDSGHE